MIIIPDNLSSDADCVDFDAAKAAKDVPITDPFDPRCARAPGIPITKGSSGPLFHARPAAFPSTQNQDWMTGRRARLARMRIARRAFRFATRTTRCWSTATAAAIRSASSQHFERVAFGPIAVLAWQAARLSAASRIRRMLRGAARGQRRLPVVRI